MGAAARAVRKRSEKSSNGSAATVSSSSHRLGPARELSAGAVKLAVVISTRSRRDRRAARATRRTRKSWVFDANTTASGMPCRARRRRDAALAATPRPSPCPICSRRAAPRPPAFDLAVEAGIGPQMMTVRRKVQSRGIRLEAPREQSLEIQPPTPVKARSSATTIRGMPACRGSSANKRRRPIRRFRACCR